MTSSIPLSSMEGGSAAQFKTIGDKHAGRIVAINQRQSTDLVTGQPKTFASGDPMMVWVISIEKPDGDTVDLWARGGKFKPANGTGESMLTAIGAAVRAASAASVDIGGELAVAFTGEGEAKPGMNPPKLYTAGYKPPSASVPVDLFTS